MSDRVHKYIRAEGESLRIIREFFDERAKAKAAQIERRNKLVELLGCEEVAFYGGGGLAGVTFADDKAPSEHWRAIKGTSNIRSNHLWVGP